MTNESAVSISVILPLYNAEEYIGEALNSILSQTLKPFEIIVINDGSTDKSLSKIELFGKKIKIINQQNKGAGAARNEGIKIAKGEYLAFLDADDVWLDNKLEEQFNYLISHPETEIVSGFVEQFISPELSVEDTNKLNPMLQNMPGYLPGAILIKKSDFLKVGFFNEQLHLGEFIDWYSRAKDLGFRDEILPYTLLRRRIHNNNMGIYKKEHVKDYLKVLRASLNRKRKNDPI